MPTPESILRSRLVAVSVVAAGILSATPAWAGVTCAVPVPQPSTLALITVAVAGLAASFIRRRRK